MRELLTHGKQTTRGTDLPALMHWPNQEFLAERSGQIEPIKDCDTTIDYICSPRV